MGASVLIIDAEEEFANQLADALRGRGAEVQITSDGKAGLDAARINIPEAIVLCVELPRMSGYSICAKLKKDPTLKSVPLVITSAEATQETFDHHKKLKTRAEEYIKKPFDPAQIVEVLGGHLDLGSADQLPEVPITEELAVEDEAPLTISDKEAFGSDAFDGLVAAPAATPPPLPPPDDEGSLDLSAGVGLIDDPGLEELDDEARTMVGSMPVMAQLQSAEAQIRELEDALQRARNERDEAVSKAAAMPPPPDATASQMPTAASGREVLAVKKELNAKERELLELKDELQSKGKDLLAARDEQMELEGRVLQVQEEHEATQAAKTAVEQELTSVRGQLEETAQRLEAVEQQAREAAARLSALEADAARAAGEAAERIAGLDSELEAARTQAGELEGQVADRTQRVAELEQSVGEKLAEVERVSAELTQRVQEIDSLAGQNRALGSEVTRLGNELSAASAESDTLREQLAATQDEVSRAEQRASALDHERESAVNALEETRQQLGVVQQDLEGASMREARSQEVRAKASQALQIAAALLAEGEAEPQPADELEDIPMEAPDLEVDLGPEGDEAAL